MDAPIRGWDNDGLNGIAADSTGVYVVGITAGTFPGYVRMEGVLIGLETFVRKYDNNGNAVWTHQFGAELTETIGFAEANGAGIAVDRKESTRLDECMVSCLVNRLKRRMEHTSGSMI